jgi:branched-chain amino acid transport system ATP-binding protein
LLTVDTVSSSYGKIQTLWDVSLHVDKGEFVALLGGNGCGKSTVLNLISGVLQVTRGSIKFNDSNITNTSIRERVSAGIVLVPEGRRVFPRMTTRENLCMGSFRARQNAKEKEEFVFELFPILRERKAQAAGTLSGGEQQMLAIARGIMADPQLLMLDEPTSGLAPAVVHKVFDSLSKLNSTGVTILLAEQNFFMSTKYAERAYIMETGRVSREGKSEDLLNDPTIRKAYLGA